MLLIIYLTLTIDAQYRIFDGVMSNLPVDGSEELPLILAASKLLDLLLVLQTEEFQLWVVPFYLYPFD